MRIIYRPHLLQRLKERKIPKEYPREIINSAEHIYFDAITNHNIAIKKLIYAGKIRNMVVAYDIIENNKEIVTIYPIAESELKNKVKAGRWKKDEKN